MALNKHFTIIIIFVSLVSLSLNVYFNSAKFVYNVKLRRFEVRLAKDVSAGSRPSDEDNFTRRFEVRPAEDVSTVSRPSDGDNFTTHNVVEQQPSSESIPRTHVIHPRGTVAYSVFPHYPYRRVKSHNCGAIIQGNETEIEKALDYMQKQPKSLRTDNELATYAKNCTALRVRGYISENITEEERNFPLAFSILMYKEAAQAERLLRVLYRPQNTYCIHIDIKAAEETVRAMQAVVDCFPNVFLARKREYIVYASVTRLQAELNCMAESLVFNADWKYYMNYASTMFPLKTNLEIVKILKVYNGTNDINGLPSIPSRYQNSFELIHDHNQNRVRLSKTKSLKSPPPLGMNLTKGSVYATFTRNFCKFMLENAVAKELLKWSEDTYSPDEHFAATLHHVSKNKKLFDNGTVPGSYRGPLHGKRWFGTYAHWSQPKGCPTKYAVHSICINGLRSLNKITQKPHFSANKFSLEFEPLAWDCMEEWYFNRTFSKTNIDLEYFASQPFVNNNWMKKKTEIVKRDYRPDR